MKAWAVETKWGDITVAVIAETRSRAKTLALFVEFLDSEDWIDLRCHQVKSPIPVEGPERVLDLPESLWYGFQWNDESMDFYFPLWYKWTAEYRKVKDWSHESVRIGSG
jgi:hypothetical protein